MRIPRPTARPGSHRRGRERRRPALPSPWRVAAVVVFAVAGTLFVTSSLDADGLDLRASSVTDLDTVVRQQRERADDLQGRVAALERQVNRLSGRVDDAGVNEVLAQGDALLDTTGFEEARGPAVTVLLSDAPKEVRRAAAERGDEDRDLLVVHQQDIQAVANALWAGGAEAMTLQGQRVISTTGIKCVGNTVILQGVPYAPPYEITAIGDIRSLLQSLETSDYVEGYQDYVATYGLGYEVSTSPEVTVPAYDGTADLRYAEVPRSQG